MQGHVDGVGEVVAPAPDLRVRMPHDLLRYVVEKGSVTVDGVSLTVVDVLDDGFTVAVIPHTQAVTTLGVRGPGDRVNLEVDVTVKYVERLLDLARGAGRWRGRLRWASPRWRRPSPPSGGARSWSSSTTRTARTRAT